MRATPCEIKSSLEIHQTRLFAKRLLTMATAGKCERIAAERAQKILRDLQSNPLHERAECKRTRHGEARLNDCRKYDLSCGFRLVALKREGRLIFTYIGSHDQCQRWIENNRDHQDAVESEPVLWLHAGNDRHPEGGIGTGLEDDEYEEQLMAKIDEPLLREIFAGLLKSAGGRR